MVTGYSAPQENVYNEDDIEPVEENYEFIQERLDAADVAKRAERVTAGNLRSRGGIVENYNKFNARTKLARLYRKIGANLCEPTPVPAELVGQLLQARHENGERVFYAKPPCPIAEPGSDPCPVDTWNGICGRRLRNQYELIMHIRRTHPSEASMYIVEYPTQGGLTQSQRAEVVRNVQPMVLREAQMPGVIREVEEPAYVKEDLPLEVYEKKLEAGEMPSIPEDSSVTAHAFFCRSKGIEKFTKNCPACATMKRANENGA